MKCQCNFDNYPCQYCYELHQQQMQAEYDKQMAEHKASLKPCVYCGKDCEYGYCHNKECQDQCLLDNLRSMIDDEKWSVDEELGKSDCSHQWAEDFDTDVDSAQAIRTCQKCGRVERQSLYSFEPPNCYVPGYGWMVI